MVKGKVLITTICINTYIYIYTFMHHSFQQTQTEFKGNFTGNQKKKEVNKLVPVKIP